MGSHNSSFETRTTDPLNSRCSTSVNPKYRDMEPGCEVMVIRRSWTWHFSLKFAGSNPPTTVQFSHFTGICWPRPPSWKNEVYCSFNNKINVIKSFETSLVELQCHSWRPPYSSLNYSSCRLGCKRKVFALRFSLLRRWESIMKWKAKWCYSVPLYSSPSEHVHASETPDLQLLPT